ncbi:sialomucin core protein 24-like isoform X2 [Anoplopoma fimbria]|uniref:sialomucin core protein 24-like isoform X2 n=1 Tax=Anoplopoma fimbria TaxID=229290 RepID=UPI0023EAF9C5|nr:sialomucin core protein 24-like isoform X2 [Anoplopoma fimbria]
MAMEAIFATLACYLLVIPFAAAQTQGKNLTPTITTPDLNMTHTPTMLSSTNSTGHGTVISSSTENTTPFTSTTGNNDTFTQTTAATSESTSHLQTSQSTTNMTPLTKTPGTPTSTALTTSKTQVTAGYISTADTTVITTVNSSLTVKTTLDPVNKTAQGLVLNISEKNMTIVFSVVLGVFALAVVVFMFQKCKHKIQYMHQPLNNTGDMGDFVADDDTLVISGGLYDGHPIYDNVPTIQADQSQFRLQFFQ